MPPPDEAPPVLFASEAALPRVLRLNPPEPFGVRTMLPDAAVDELLLPPNRLPEGAELLGCIPEPEQPASDPSAGLIRNESRSCEVSESKHLLDRLRPIRDAGRVKNVLDCLPDRAVDRIGDVAERVVEALLIARRVGELNVGLAQCIDRSEVVLRDIAAQGTFALRSRCCSWSSAVAAWICSGVDP